MLAAFLDVRSPFVHVATRGMQHLPPLRSNRVADPRVDVGISTLPALFALQDDYSSLTVPCSKHRRIAFVAPRSYLSRCLCSV